MNRPPEVRGLGPLDNLEAERFVEGGQMEQNQGTQFSKCWI